jgi:hypothetical protein
MVVASFMPRPLTPRASEDFGLPGLPSPALVVAGETSRNTSLRRLLIGNLSGVRSGDSAHLCVTLQLFIRFCIETHISYTSHRWGLTLTVFARCFIECPIRKRHVSWLHNFDKAQQLTVRLLHCALSNTQIFSNQ